MLSISERLEMDEVKKRIAFLEEQVAQLSADSAIKAARASSNPAEMKRDDMFRFLKDRGIPAVPPITNGRLRELIAEAQQNEA